MMENRIGAVIILVDREGDVERINRILSDHSDIILGRQGLSLRDRPVNIISLVLEGDTDRLGSLTGKLGKLPGIRVRSVLAR